MSASVVEGVVQDGTGAMIQKSEVTLLNPDTGGKLSTRTNGDGVYVSVAVSKGCLRGTNPNWRVTCK